MSSDDSSSGGSSFGSAVGSLMGTVFQFNLLHDKKFLKSMQDLTQSQHRSGAESFERERRTSDHPERYEKTLTFKGYRITPRVRDNLFRRMMASDNYDDFNPFERGLTNWILEEKPYDNDVVPPPPLPPRVTPGAKRNFLIVCGFAAPITLLISAVAGAMAVAFMAGVLVITVVQTLAVMNKVVVDKNTVWMQALLDEDAATDAGASERNDAGDADGQS